MGLASSRYVCSCAWMDKYVTSHFQNTTTQNNRAGQRAVLFSHAPLHPQSCTPDCLCWNYQDILALLARHKGRVALCLAGHAHAARVQVDADGTGAVFVVLDSPLEQSDAFSTVRVYGDRIEVQGVGANANASAVVPL